MLSGMNRPHDIVNCVHERPQAARTKASIRTLHHLLNHAPQAIAFGIVRPRGGGGAVALRLYAVLKVSPVVVSV